jgi:hypothetical protein
MLGRRDLLLLASRIQIGPVLGRLNMTGHFTRGIKRGEEGST